MECPYHSTSCQRSGNPRGRGGLLQAVTRRPLTDWLLYVPQGADAQIHDTLRLLIDGGNGGATAVEAMDGAQLESIAGEMDAAADDIAVAGRRLLNGGAALPDRKARSATTWRLERMGIRTRLGRAPPLCSAEVNVL